jgi:hypothetical protein
MGKAACLATRAHAFLEVEAHAAASAAAAAASAASATSAAASAADILGFGRAASVALALRSKDDCAARRTLPVTRTHLCAAAAAAARAGRLDVVEHIDG